MIVTEYQAEFFEKENGDIWLTQKMMASLYINYRFHRESAFEKDIWRWRVVSRFSY